MEELDFKDLNVVYSDSDASEYREEEALLEIDNTVMS